MPKKTDSASSDPTERPSGPTPEEKRDRTKAVIFLVGAIAFVIVLKFILGY